MDTLLEIQNNTQETVLSLAQATLLSFFITCTTILGISYGKSMEKTVMHIDIPSIHNIVTYSRRVDER